MTGAIETRGDFERFFGRNVHLSGPILISGQITPTTLLLTRPPGFSDLPTAL